MPLNSKNWNRPRTKRYRAFGVTLAALLLAGCGGYFANEWPNLAEGFADAAERDAALEEAATGRESDLEPVSEAEPEPAPEAGEALPSNAAPVAAAPPSMQLLPEEIQRLGAELEVAARAIALERQAYEGARKAFLGGDQKEEAARGRWLTAQLKLSGLSRTGNPLESISADLPLADACAGGEDSETCALARRAAKASADLTTYLAEERTFLAARDPAGSN